MAVMSDPPASPEPLPDDAVARNAGPRVYLRDECGLCDQALAVLAVARVPAPTCVVIDDVPALEARYGERVPVLARADGDELAWPFDADAVRAWWVAGDPATMA